MWNVPGQARQCCSAPEVAAHADELTPQDALCSGNHSSSLSATL